MKALRLWWQQYTTSETMGVSLVIWLCSLVVIGLVVTPWLGPQIAGVVALGLLLMLLAICWGVCIVQVVRKGKNP